MLRPLLRSLVCVAFLLVPAAFADSKAAWEVLRDKDALPDDRWKAAQEIIGDAALDGTCAKVVPELMDFSLKATTPEVLRTLIANGLRPCDGPEVAKFIVSKLGGGKPVERTWTIHVARNLKSPDVDKAVLAKGLTDADANIRRDAVQILVDHEYEPALPAFQAILRAGKDQELLVPLVGAISTMLADKPEWTQWETRLKELARGQDDELRRAALSVLAGTRDVSFLDLFLEMLAHPDWSTRALAVGFLEKSGSKQAVGALIEQMRNETSDTRMLGLIRTTLERLSGGMNFGDKVDDWATWWQNNEADFKFPKKTGAGRTASQRPRPSGTGVPAEFFGIEVESQRVCFVIDISGSMTEPVKEGAEASATRMDAAKRELGKIIDLLPPGSLFNIITFATDVESWLDHVGDLPSGIDTRTAGGRKGPSTGDRDKQKEKTPAQIKKEAEDLKKFDEALRAKAQSYVRGLKANGGTNIHDALQLAFEDPAIDTIFFLTDGAPTAGREVDPRTILDAVKRWNATRRVKINTIAVGTQSGLVKQLAKENDGEYRYTE